MRIYAVAMSEDMLRRLMSLAESKWDMTRAGI